MPKTSKPHSLLLHQEHDSSREAHTRAQKLGNMRRADLRIEMFLAKSINGQFSRINSFGQKT